MIAGNETSLEAIAKPPSLEPGEDTLHVDSRPAARAGPESVSTHGPALQDASVYRFVGLINPEKAVTTCTC